MQLRGGPRRALQRARGRNQRTAVRNDVYAPALQAVLKSTLFDEARGTIIEVESFEFDAIAAR